MLTRKGNLICKALVFTFAVITAMTLDSCCDDCLGGSKSNKNHNLIITNEYRKKTKTENEDKEKAGFKKTNDEKFFWIFETPLSFSAKEEKLYNVDKAVSIFEYIFSNYLTGFNNEFSDQKIAEGVDYSKIIYEVVITGNTEVGKTQICNVGTGEGEFEEKYFPTGMVSSVLYKTKHSNKNFNFRIWDTSGKNFYTLRSFFNNASIIILVFDITNKQSFENLDSLLYNEIKNNAPEEAAIFIVGNKCDLGEEKQEIELKAVNDWISDKCEQK